MTEELYEAYTRYVMHQCGDAWLDVIMAAKWELAAS